MAAFSPLFPEAQPLLPDKSIEECRALSVVSPVLDWPHMTDSLPSDSIRKKETVYVLSPLTESSSQDGREILIADILRGIWRRRWIIAAVAILGGLAGFGLARVPSRTYEATATLLIQPPQFSSELQPAALQVHAYQALLNTDYTLTQVRDALVEDGVLPQGSGLRGLREMVSTTIPETTGRLPQSLPMIKIAVSASLPEQAERIANTYARVFVQMSREITTRGQEGALQFIESQYPAAGERLQAAFVKGKERQDHFARAGAELARGWSERLARFNAETDDLVTEYQIETNRLTLEFLKTNRPQALQAQLQLREHRLIKLEGDLGDTRLELKSAQYALAEIQHLIKDQPRKLSLDQAFANGPWWSQVSPEDAIKLAARVADIALTVEVPNQVYTDLMEKLVEAEVEARTLEPRAQDLQADLDRLQREVEVWGKKLMTVQLEQFALAEERERGLARLREKRAFGLADLTSQRDIATGDLTRNQDLEVAAMARESAAAESTFELIAEKYESVQLAKSGQEPDVKVGALALRPESAVARNTLLKTAVGLLAAFLLAFFGAAVAEALSIPGAKGEYGLATGSQLAAEGSPTGRLVES